MTHSALPRERDLRALTSVVVDGLRDDPGEVMPWAVLEGLLRLIPSDGVQAEECDLSGRRILTQQALADGGQRCVRFDLAIGDTRFWSLREEFKPTRYPLATGDAASPVRYSDFYASSELRRAPFYAEYLAPDRDGLIVLLPTASCWSRRIVFWRSHQDFDERDCLVLQLLRPHLQEVYLDAERRRRDIPRLSRREREVLRLAAEGHSNAEIATRLFISVATVRKHLEHIFDRTGVRTRGAAAALALPSPLRLASDVRPPTARGGNSRRAG